jgi:hypothetical protein
MHEGSKAALALEAIFRVRDLEFVLRKTIVRNHAMRKETHFCAEQRLLAEMLKGYVEHRR